MGSNTDEPNYNYDELSKIYFDEYNVEIPVEESVDERVGMLLSCQGETTGVHHFKCIIEEHLIRLGKFGLLIIFCIVLILLAIFFLRKMFSKGWFCCCCPPIIEKPLKIIDEVKTYALNYPPGKYPNSTDQYMPSPDEIKSYEKLMDHIKRL